MRFGSYQSEMAYYIGANFTSVAGEAKLSVLQFVLTDDPSGLFDDQWLSSFSDQFLFERVGERLFENRCPGARELVEMAAMGLADNFRFGTTTGLRPAGLPKRDCDETFGIGGIMSEWLAPDANTTVFCFETDQPSLVEVSQCADDAGLQWCCSDVAGPNNSLGGEVILMSSDWYLLKDIAHSLASCASIHRPEWVDVDDEFDFKKLGKR